MRIKNTKDLKIAIRQGDFYFPGGYPLYFVMNDGGTVCPQCIRENYKIVLDSVKHEIADDWNAIAIKVNYEEEETCSNCYKEIPSAY